MTTYKDSGVDIEIAEKAKDEIKKLVRQTYNDKTVMDAGFFCGGMLADFRDYREPVLMLSNDGVGTKMAIARMMNKYDSIGFDLVNHCANDILMSGAKPLFFLDYIASEKIVPEVSVEIVRGIVEACKKLGIVLIGGETAQMPGVYVKGETDVAGTIGGIVERSEILDGRLIREGDAIIGVASAGLHTNGYSLARKVLFEDNKFSVNDELLPEITLGNALLEPHREYVTLYFEMRKHIRIKGMSHVTGGGMTDNIPRILPRGLGAKIVKGTWEVLPIFNLIKEKGNVPEEDMIRTFNMGIGLVIVVDKSDATGALFRLRQMKEKAWVIGEVTKGEGVVYAEG